VSYQTLVSEKVADKVILLRLNRPERFNAMNVKMFEEIGKTVKEVDGDDLVSVVIVAGEGGSFSSGLDFYDFFEYASSREGFDLLDHIKFMQDIFLSIFNSRKVYISAIDGYCIGAGLDLAVSCDLRIATEAAKFSVAETRLGIVADLGVLQHLPRIIGEQNARYLSYTSEMIRARKAKQMGLILETVETQDKLFTRAKEIAIRIAANPQNAVANTKRSINFGLENSISESLRYTAKFNLSLDQKELMENFSKRSK